MRKQPLQSKKSPQSNVRVIGGKWRNSKIHFVAEKGLRPTGDRIRETLFNWLSPFIRNSDCLDLFAGSGALGIEALSRDAGKTVFIEKSAVAAENIKQTLQRLEAGGSFILEQKDALQWLDTASEKFDIVFLDPPFATDLVLACCQKLEQNQLLRDEAFIYIELPRRHDDLELPDNWQQLRKKASGDVCYLLYQRNSFEVSA